MINGIHYWNRGQLECSEDFGLVVTNKCQESNAITD